MSRLLLLFPMKAIGFAAFFYACGGFLVIPFGG